MTRLDTGSSLDSKYRDRMGITGVACIPPPTRTSMIVIGPSNQGKSCFLQSCPGNFIINTDTTSTTNPDLQANLWPFVGTEDGRLYDYPDGPEITLTWQAVLDRVDVLCEMAKDQWPGRPKVVSLDTVDTAVPLVMEHVVQNAHKLGLASENKVVNTWNDLHGPSAWNAVYNTFTALRSCLMSHGYGVIFSMHLVREKTLRINEEQTALRKNQPRVTENFWGRLYPDFETIAAVALADITTEREVVQKHPQTGEPIVDKKTGKPRTKKVKDTSNEYALIFDQTQMPIAKKRRRELPDYIPLSPTNGWSDYEKAYYESIDKEAIPKENENDD